MSLDGDSTLFHSINRNKQAYAADLKNSADLAQIRKPSTKAILTSMKPPSRILIIDCSQFLAGPSASLRMADRYGRRIPRARDGLHRSPG